MATSGTILTKDEIARALRDIKRPIESLGVARLGLLGSFARAEHTPENDADFPVESIPGQKTLKSFMGLAFLLEDILQRRVEIVIPETQSAYMGPHILEEVEHVSLAA